MSMYVSKRKGENFTGSQPETKNYRRLMTAGRREISFCQEYVRLLLDQSSIISLETMYIVSVSVFNKR